MLTEALKCAQRAVKLDAAKTDLSLAVAPYDEAITILQSVIARRSQKPAIASEVERVTSIVSQPLPFPLPSRSLPTSFFVMCGTVGAHSQGLLFLAVSFCSFCSVRVCSMTDTQIVYASCVARTESPCRAMFLPPAAGFPHR